MVKTWIEEFQVYDPETLWISAKEWIRFNKFFPKVAEMRMLCTKERRAMRDELPKPKASEIEARTWTPPTPEEKAYVSKLMQKVVAHDHEGFQALQTEWRATHGR